MSAAGATATKAAVVGAIMPPSPWYRHRYQDTAVRHRHRARVRRLSTTKEPRIVSPQVLISLGIGVAISWREAALAWIALLILLALLTCERCHCQHPVQ